MCCVNWNRQLLCGLIHQFRVLVRASRSRINRSSCKAINACVASCVEGSNLSIGSFLMAYCHYHYSWCAGSPDSEKPECPDWKTRGKWLRFCSESKVIKGCNRVHEFRRNIFSFKKRDDKNKKEKCNPKTRLEQARKETPTQSALSKGETSIELLVVTEYKITKSN